MLAVLPPLELVEHAVGERPEALRASVGRRNASEITEMGKKVASRLSDFLAGGLNKPCCCLAKHVYF